MPECDHEWKYDDGFTKHVDFVEEDEMLIPVVCKKCGKVCMEQWMRIDRVDKGIAQIKEVAYIYPDRIELQTMFKTDDMEHWEGLDLRIIDIEEIEKILPYLKKKQKGKKPIVVEIWEKR